MVEAQQIEFFGGKGGGEGHLESSPESPLLYKDG